MRRDTRRSALHAAVWLGTERLGPAHHDHFSSADAVQRAEWTGKERPRELYCIGGA